MTGRACSSCGSVFRMIKFDVETAQGRKGFHLSALNIRVTDGADFTSRIRELLRVTARAGRMRSFAGQGRLRRVVLATMAKQTGKPGVIAIVVFKL